MNSRAAADLVTEAERHLAAVAVFRAEGREPHWRLEVRAQLRRRRTSNSELRDLLDPASRVGMRDLEGHRIQLRAPTAVLAAAALFWS